MSAVPPTKRPMPLTAAIGLALLAAPPLEGDDWPIWLGPTRDGISRETGWRKDWPAEGPPRLFDKSIGEGYSAVAVSRGRLLLFHRVRDEERLESLDPLTGKEGWKAGSPTDYVDQYGYNNGPRAAPVVDPGSASGPGCVYTISAKGLLQCLELSSGRKLWSHDIEGEFKVERFFFGVGPAPLIDGNLVVVNLGGADMGTGTTFAFDKLDGRLAWKTATDGGSYAVVQPAEIDGARHLFVFHRGGLSCLDPQGGRERWKFPWHSRLYESVNAATPLVIGDIVFFSASYRTGGVSLRVRKDSHEVLWKDDLESREKILDTHWSTATHVDGHLYGFGGRHEGEAQLTCVELKTGRVLWRWASELGRGSAIYADGHFIALGERGDLALLKLSPKGHEEVKKLPRVLSYPAWTPPVLANGVLYLRDEKRLIAFDLRPRVTVSPPEK